MAEIIYTVTDGAALKCTLGLDESELKVPEHHGVMAKGGSAGTILDSVPYVNIFPFCKCLRAVPGVQPLYPDEPVVICTPEVLMNWVNGRKDRIVDGEMALINICIVPCMYGGIISIEKSGQKKEE